MSIETLLEKIQFIDPEDDQYWMQLAIGIKNLSIEESIRMLKLIHHGEDSN